MKRTMLHIGILLLYLVSAGSALGEKSYTGKKILFVDSYHAGYVWSDGVASGVDEVLKGTGVVLKRVEMDTKRNTSEEFKKAAAERVNKIITTYKPDVVIACDDNAAKYLIMPYYKDAGLPFVFCGVNWDASVYGFPYKNVTGIVETDLATEVFRQLQKYAHGDRMGLIGDDTLTTRKSARYHQELLRIEYKKVAFVKTFKQWQEAFMALQDQVDMLMLINQAGISDWDDSKAREFVSRNTKIPSGTVVSWMTPVSLLGVVKKPEEHGTWAARAALAILDGTSPDKIPMSHNRLGKLFFNPVIGKKLGIHNAPSGAVLVK